MKILQLVYKTLNSLPKYKFIFSSIWTIIILYLSLGHISSPDKITVIPYLDKVVHLSMYFILTILLLFELQLSTKKNTIAMIMLYSLLFGSLMEILQSYIFVYRSGDYLDFIFNSLGTIVALFFFKHSRKPIKL